MRLRISKTKLYIWIFVIIALALLAFLLSDAGRQTIEIGNNNGSLLDKFAPSDCKNPTSRPVAIMLSSDPEPRPLSGIGQADIVFEMPVTEGGVTRMMAIYQCEHPKEIGSIRSARLDFIPLVQGLDAIYAHWGGEAEALKQLNAGVTDNVNGLIYDGTVYYRKDGIPMPHDGFTTHDNLIDKARDLGYSTTDERIDYKYEKSESEGTLEPPVLYTDDFEVSWSYDAETNAYSRIRAGTPEIDKNTDEQVEVANVMIMRTSWSPISVDYIRVDTIGSGDATLYKNGEFINGRWEKKSHLGSLMFHDENGDEMIFADGSIWIEIVID
ncbi:MAG: DUF3048 domain-containing protein [Parcubacteria group bacterium]